MMRFQGPPRAEALNHTPIHQVNNLLAELIDGKPIMSTSENKIEIVTLKYLLNLRVEAYRISVINQVNNTGCFSLSLVLGVSVSSRN